LGVVVVCPTNLKMSLHLEYRNGFNPTLEAKSVKEGKIEFTQLHIVVQEDGLERITKDKRTNKIIEDLRNFAIAAGALSGLSLTMVFPRDTDQGFWNAFHAIGVLTTELNREYERKERDSLDNLFRYVTVQCGPIEITASSPIRHARYRLRVGGTDHPGPMQTFARDFGALAYQSVINFGLIREIDLRYEPGAPEVVLALAPLFKEKKRMEIHALRITGSGMGLSWAQALSVFAGSLRRTYTNVAVRSGVESLIFEDSDAPTMQAVRLALSPEKDRWTANVGTLRRLVIRGVKSRISPDVLRETVQFIPEKSGDKEDEERGLKGIDKRGMERHFEKITAILELATRQGPNVPMKELAECAFHALYGLRTGQITLAKTRFEKACNGQPVPPGTTVGDPEFQGDEQMQLARGFLDMAPLWKAEIDRFKVEEGNGGGGQKKAGVVDPAKDAHRKNLMDILGPRFSVPRYLQSDRTFPTLLSLIIEDKGDDDEVLADRIWYEQELKRIAYAATPFEALQVVKKSIEFFGLYELSFSGTRLSAHATREMAATMLVSKALTRLSLFKAGTNGDWDRLAVGLPLLKVLQTDDKSLRTKFDARPTPEGELKMSIYSMKRPLRPWYRIMGYADGRAFVSIPKEERETRYGRREIEAAQIRAAYGERVRRARVTGVVYPEAVVAAGLENMTEEEIQWAMHELAADIVPEAQPSPSPPPPPPPPADKAEPIQNVLNNIVWELESPDIDFSGNDAYGGSESPPPPSDEPRTQLHATSTHGRYSPRPGTPPPRTPRETPRTPRTPAETPRTPWTPPSETPRTPREAVPLRGPDVPRTPAGEDSSVAELDEGPNVEVSEEGLRHPPSIVPSGREKRQRYVNFTEVTAGYVVPAWAEESRVREEPDQSSKILRDYGFGRDDRTAPSVPGPERKNPKAPSGKKKAIPESPTPVTPDSLWDWSLPDTAPSQEWWKGGMWS
jgi:hypothetical protein